MASVVRDPVRYSANTIGLVPASTASDIFTITGAAGKLVKIKKILITGIQTTAGQVLFVVLKRSAAATGGVSSTLTAVPFDSNDSAAAAVVRAYTANPTPGTLIGRVAAARNLIPAAATAAAQEVLEFDFETLLGRPLTLRSASEVLAVGLNSVTVSGGALDLTVIWTEE